MYRLINISKEYDDDKKIIQVLKNININIPSKGTVFIVGKSGSGKSTLLNILGGLENPTSGSIKYNDCEINNLIFKRDTVSFVFQDFNLLNDLSVIDNLRIVNDLAIDQIYELLNSVDMINKINTKIKYLSIGEKQRLAIARALAKNYEIILLDEPTGNLDTQNSKIIFDLLKNISKDKLVIIVTHDLDSAHEYFDCMFEITDGNISGILSKNSDLANNPVSESQNGNYLKTSNNAIFNKKLQFKYALSLLFVNKIGIIITMLMFLLSSTLALTQVNLANFNVGNTLYNALQTNNDFSVPIKEFIQNDPTYEIYEFSKGEELYNKLVIGNESQPISYLRSTNIYNKNQSSLDQMIIHLLNDDLNPTLIIEGKFPTNKKEILISDFFAFYNFGSTNVIGETIIFPVEYLDMELTLKIVGVVKTNYKDIELFSKLYDDVYINKHKDVLTFNYMSLFTKSEYLFKEIMENTVKIPAANFLQSEQLTELYVQLLSTLKYKRINDEVVVSGMLPTKLNQVLVSSSFLSKYGLKFNDLKEKFYAYKDIRATINKNKYLDILNMFEVTSEIQITGVVESDSDILITDAFATIIENKFKDYAISGYSVQSPSITLIKSLETFNIYFDFRYLGPVYTIENTLNGPIMTLILIIEIIVLILSIFSLLLYFLSIIKNKKREIAIIKSLGVSNFKMFNVFLTHNFILAILSTFLGITMGIFFIKILNIIVADVDVFDINYELFLIEPISILILIMISLAVVIIGTLVPFLNVKKISISTELKIN